MHVELRCSHCPGQCDPLSERLTSQVLDQLREEGPWFSLGDGETLEDHIYATLTPPGKDRCPECGESLSVTEESLGQLARSLLTSW